MSFRFSELGDGLSSTARLLISFAEEVMRDVEARSKLDCSPVTLYRPVILARPVEYPSHVSVDDERRWIKRLGAFDLGDGLRVSPHRRQIKRIPLMSCCIARIEFKGAPALCFRSRIVPIKTEFDPRRRQ